MEVRAGSRSMPEMEMEGAEAGASAGVTDTAATWFAGTPGNACTNADTTACTKVSVTSVGAAPCKVK